MQSEIRTLFKALILSIFVTGCGGMNNENEPEQDEMAYDYLDLGPQYFALSSAGKPVAGGQIFIGNVNTDPEIPANQKQVQLILENGSRVNVDQPVRTGAGGVIEYNGSPAIMTTDGDYSMKVLSSNGTQVYYFSEKKATGIPSVNVQDSILLIDGTSPNPSIGYIDHPSDGIYHTGTTINIKQGGGDSPIASLDDISANSVASVSAGTNINITGTTANPVVNVDPALVTYIDEKSAHSDSASTSPLNDCNDLYGAVGVAYQIFDEDTLNHPSGSSNAPGYGGGYIMNVQDFSAGGATQLAYYGPSTGSGSTTVRVRFFKLNDGWTGWERLATTSDIDDSVGYPSVRVWGGGIEFSVSSAHIGDLVIIKSSVSGAYVDFPEQSVSGMRIGARFRYVLHESSTNVNNIIQIQGVNWTIVDQWGSPTTTLGLRKAGDTSTVVVTDATTLTIYTDSATQNESTTAQNPSVLAHSVQYKEFSAAHAELYKSNIYPIVGDFGLILGFTIGGVSSGADVAIAGMDQVPVTATKVKFNVIYRFTAVAGNTYSFNMSTAFMDDQDPAILSRRVTDTVWFTGSGISNFLSKSFDSTMAYDPSDVVSRHTSLALPMQSNDGIPLSIVNESVEIKVLGYWE